MTELLPANTHSTAFNFTEKQEAALDLLSSEAQHTLLAGGSRCVAGDTLLDGHTQTIKELAELGLQVRVMTSHGSQLADAPFKKGSCALLKFTFASGHAIEVTPDHRFWDGKAWVKAETLKPGDALAVAPATWTPPKFEFLTLLRTLFSNDTPSKAGYRLSKVLDIQPTAVQDYYTLHVPGCEHYFANGVASHNSGKSFLLVRQVILRALKAKNSRHVIFRYRFNAIKASIVNDTFPKVMRLVFPYVKYDLNKTDWYVTLPNGSEVWFAGLDDKERAEKILGMEFATLFFNEASQIPYQSIMLALTRLAQFVVQLIPGKDGEADKEIELLPRVFYDLNPPSKAHWSYKLFILKVDPDSKVALAKPENYAWMRINPKDNLVNLASTYMDTLYAMSARNKLRFLEGEFCETMANALFTYENIETYRHLKGELPEFVRVVVGVDPSGAADANSTGDAIGIVVGALGTDGRAYLLEDLTVTAGPVVWGRVATTAYDRHQADCIVGEGNFGGAMVEHVIQTSRPRTPYKMVTASRGKHIRAEPISALYEEGKVIHVGNFPELEEELTSFSTTGYMGDSSPNRCFIAGTLITTEAGDIAIEAVVPGNRVLTRQGYRQVLHSGMNDANAQTMTVEFSDGRTLTATPGHPVFIEGKGFIRVDEMVWGDKALMLNHKPAPVFVVKLTANDLKQPVYNLAVDSVHEYFANGVLVANCDAWVWVLAELFQGIVAPRKKKPEPYIPPFRASVDGMGY